MLNAELFLEEPDTDETVDQTGRDLVQAQTDMVDVLTEAFFQKQALVTLEQCGIHQTTLNMVQRAGLFAGVSGDVLSLESLGGMADDAAKALAHGAGHDVAELGAKVLRRAMGVEKTALRVEQEFLEEIHRAQRIFHNSMRVPGGNRTVADVAAARLKYMSPGEQAAAAAFTKNPVEQVDRIFAARIAAQEKTVRAAKAAYDKSGGAAAEAELKRRLAEKAGDPTRIAKAKELVKEAHAKKAEALKKAREEAAKWKKMREAKAQAAHLTNMQSHYDKYAAEADLAAAKVKGLKLPETTSKKFVSAKNAMIALAAAGAVAGGIKLLLSSAPAANATPEAKNAFFGKITQWVKSIKLPWAKLDVSPEGKLMANGVVVKSPAKEAEELALKTADGKPAGWTKEALAKAEHLVKGTGTRISDAFGGLSTKLKSMSEVGHTAWSSAAEQFGKNGVVAKYASRFAKDSYFTMIMVLIALVASVIYFTVIGGINISRKSLKAQ